MSKHDTSEVFEDGDGVIHVTDVSEVRFPPKEPAKAEAYPHYYRKLPAGTTHVDVYRVLDLFEVKRSSVAHAIKKLLCMGRRGAKDELRDLEEARDSIDRAIEMLKEEES